MQQSDEISRQSSLRIYVVDDNRLIRDALIQVLEQHPGTEVVGKAATAADAISEIEALQPDVIILDLHMPGPGGLHVLKTIREQGSKAIVMVFTVYNHHQYRVECKRLGADFFFSKTVDNELMFEELIALAKERGYID